MNNKDSFIEGDLDIASVFASSAHDIKNTLGLLLNTIESAVEESMNTPSLHTKLIGIRNDTSQAINQLVQLLSVYSVETSRYAMNVQYYNVYDFLREMHIQNKPILDTKGFTFELDCPKDIYWFFDRDLCTVLINNVLTNAYRYTRDKIFLTARIENGFLVIQIDDNGIGFSEEMLFNFLAKKGMDSKNKSTGLGIYLSMKLAKAHKNREKEGCINIEKGGKYGGGSFSVYLP